MRSFLVVVALGAALGGCSGASYVLERYNGIVPTSQPMPDDNYRIFDKSEEMRIMITPSFGASASQGFIRGATFFAADTDVPKPRYEEAVRTYLNNTGRSKCRITDGYVLIRPQWEFKYVCAKGAT